MCVLCTCVCVYACFCVSTCVRFCALCRSVCLCIRVCICDRMHVCVYIYVHVFVCTCVCMCTCACVCMCMCVRVQHFSCPLSQHRKVLTVGLPLSAAQHLVSIPFDVVNFGAPAPQPGENCHFLETKSCDVSGYGIGSLPKTIAG